MSATDFSRLMNQFYAVATEALMRTDAFIDKLVGDEVIGLYFPLFTGPNHARAAVQAAQDLLRVTGHGDKKGPWLPVGVGVHTGIAFVGTVKGAEDIGISATNKVLLIVHTEHEVNEAATIIRIISCRKATASERRTYEDGED